MHKHNVTDFVNLQRLPQAIRDLIHEGKPKGERSNMGDFRVACAMVEQGYTDEEIQAIFLNSEYGISGKTLEQRNPTDYLRRTIEKARGASRQPAKTGPAVDICVLTLSSFMALDIPEREQLLGPPFRHPGAFMVYGDRGIGKTRFALALAKAVAEGGEFLGWKASKPRGVLYIDGELPASQLKDMIGETQFSKKEALFRVIPYEIQQGRMLDLAKREDQVALDPHLDGIELIIADSLSTLCRSYIENDADSWTPINDWILRMRKGRSILILHHTNKGGGQRGTSRKEDTLDTVLELCRPEGYGPEEGAKFEVHVAKGRTLFGEDAAPFTAEMVVSDGVQQWHRSVISKAPRRNAYMALYEQGLTISEIAKQEGVHKTVVSRAVKLGKRNKRL